MIESLNETVYIKIKGNEMNNQNRKDKQRKYWKWIQTIAVVSAIVMVAAGTGFQHYVDESESKNITNGRNTLQAAGLTILEPEDATSADISLLSSVEEINSQTTESVSWEELEQTLQTSLNGYDGDWSLYIKDLAGDRSISLNSHEMQAASLIKLYIMGAVYQQAEMGNLTLYGNQISEELDQMITISDNESANELVRALEPESEFTDCLDKVNSYIEAAGFLDTKQINGIGDVSLWSGEGVNTTSVNDCGEFLESVYRKTLVSEEASNEMLDLLLQQEVDYKIPESLPSNIKVANKTGETDDCENDCAIVYSDGGDYVICVMSEGWTSDDEAVTRIQDISQMVYRYFNP